VGGVLDRPHPAQVSILFFFFNKKGKDANDLKLDELKRDEKVCLSLSNRRHLSSPISKVIWSKSISGWVMAADKLRAKREETFY
jgi:hypothetical protein